MKYTVQNQLTPEEWEESDSAYSELPCEDSRAMDIIPSQNGLITDIPSELLCEIARYLEDEELIKFATQICRSLRQGAEYAYVRADDITRPVCLLTVCTKAKRFFTTRQVATRIDSMLGFLDQCAAGRFVKCIQTLVFRVDTALWQLWGSEAGATIPALWSERVHNQARNARLPVSSYSISKDLVNTFQRISNHKLHFKSFSDVLKQLPVSIGIRIEPQDTSNGFGPSSIYHIQHCLIQDLFESIRQSAKKITHFQIGQILPCRTVYAVAGQTLDPLYLNFENYRTLRTLSLECRSDDGSSFLHVLSQTECLRHFTLKQKTNYARNSQLRKRSDDILHLLGDHPKFSLHTLELKGILATSGETFDKVFRVHAKTLRYISLEDVKLRAPNTILAFFQALAEIDLEYLGLKNFEPREGIRWVPCQELWGVVYDGDQGEDTACKGEQCGHDSCSGWAMLTRIHKTSQDWLTYKKEGTTTDTVKEMMEDFVVAAQCGAI